MVRLISKQRGGLAALKLTKLFGIDDFPAAKDSGKVLIIIIYCYLIIIIMHQAHYEKSDWSRAFNQFTIACELDMINAISRLQILHLSCQVQRLPGY